MVSPKIYYTTLGHNWNLPLFSGIRQQLFCRYSDCASRVCLRHSLFRFGNDSSLFLLMDQKEWRVVEASKDDHAWRDDFHGSMWGDIAFVIDDAIGNY